MLERSLLYEGNSKVRQFTVHKNQSSLDFTIGRPAQPLQSLQPLQRSQINIQPRNQSFDLGPKRLTRHASRLLPARQPEPQDAEPAPSPAPLLAPQQKRHFRVHHLDNLVLAPSPSLPLFEKPAAARPQLENVRRRLVPPPTLFKNPMFTRSRPKMRATDPITGFTPGAEPLRRMSDYGSMVLSRK